MHVTLSMIDVMVLCGASPSLSTCTLCLRNLMVLTRLIFVIPGTSLTFTCLAATQPSQPQHLLNLSIYLHIREGSFSWSLGACDTTNLYLHAFLTTIEPLSAM